MSVSDKPMTWEQVTEYVTTGNIANLTRSFECLERYHNFKRNLESKGVDLTTNLLRDTLHWIPQNTDITTPIKEILPKIHCVDPRPFANVNDMTIVGNDFPYFFEPGVEHVCVWLKFPLPPDKNSIIGDLSDENKRLVDKYVTKTFIEGLALDKKNVLWFKNYAALQSVKAIPHIHVLIRNGDHEKIESLKNTGGKPIDYEDTESCKL